MEAGSAAAAAGREKQISSSTLGYAWQCALLLLADWVSDNKKRRSEEEFTVCAPWQLDIPSVLLYSPVFLH